MWGRTTTLTPAEATSSAATLLGVGVTLAEADAVARRHRVLEAGQHGTTQVAQTVGVRVEGLVGVQVHADAEVVGDAEQGLGGGPGAVVLEVRAPADEVGAGGHGVAQQRTLIRSGDPRHRPAAQRHDLDGDHVTQPVPDALERLDAAQGVLGGHVDVGAHRDVAVGRHQPRRPLGSLGDVIDGRQMAVGRHRLDGAHQVAGGVDDAFGEERLVEVGVRFHGGREQEPTLELDDLVARLRRQRAHGADRAVDHQHVARRLAGHSVVCDPRPPQQGRRFPGLSKPCARNYDHD